MTAALRPRACAACLRRAWLVGSLAGHIEKAVSRTPGSRAREVLALPDEELARAMARSQAASLVARAKGRDPELMLAAIAGSGAWATCAHDEAYPKALSDLGDAPAVIFGRGDPGRLAGLPRDDAVTIVGSRRPSRYGKEVARTLGWELASAGVAVVSGMALGIDSCVHEGALEAGGLTVAVLGTGVDVPYPRSATRLYERIVARGVVIGELPPGTRARRWMFPARNRIMAALGRMTVVVEARGRSGSLITAEMAQDLNREVGAVPGRVGTSPAAGTNALLHEGAHVIRGAQDVLDALIGPDAERAIRPANGPALEPELASVLDLVERGDGSADALARAARMEPGRLAAALVRLELGGYVRSDSAGRYERTTLAVPQAL
ncbi:MAG TPA: DNA-processing protein DprA [Solirubrobacterales bacterium]|nr:DNA-processing protein DprA [Solirubrobacterales bacterium]